MKNRMPNDKKFVFSAYDGMIIVIIDTYVHAAYLLMTEKCSFKTGYSVHLANGVLIS